MSFASSLKRLFGFGSDYDDCEMADSESSNPTTTEGEVVKAANDDLSEGLEEIVPMPIVNPEMKAKIFDGVVAVFNSALPDFLHRSVNPEQQKKILVEALDTSLNDYLNSLMLEAEKFAESKLKNAAEASRRDAEKLRTEMQHLEQQRTTLREQQLSADRRRRALADRVNDLEQRVASAEAEREQFQLENKSLLNKLKVADVQTTIVDELNKEIEQLKSELEQTGNSTGSEGIISKEQLEDLHKQLADTMSANDNLKEQQRMSELMYNDLQQQLATEKEKLAKVTNELNEAKAYLSALDELKTQMEQVEAMIRKRDERIARLKTVNKQLKQECERLNAKLAENQSDLFSIALTDEEAVHQQNTACDAQAEYGDDKNKELAAIEDDFECPEWFTAIPDDNLQSLKGETKDDFGYTEPPRKPRHPESDAQLSLF